MGRGHARYQTLLLGLAQDMKRAIRSHPARDLVTASRGSRRRQNHRFDPYRRQSPIAHDQSLLYFSNVPSEVAHIAFPAALLPLP